MNNIYLNELEKKTLTFLAKEKSLNCIRRAIGLHGSAFHSFLHRLRKKTAISNLKDPKRVQRYFADYAAAMSGPRPTPFQMELLAKVSLVGFQRAINTPEEMQEFKEARARAALFAKDMLQTQCRLYLISCNPPDPQKLSPVHKRALELFARGMEIPDITDTLKGPQVASKLIREGCVLLGIVSRGRGVQRKLAAIALERMKDPMNDPMF